MAWIPLAVAAYQAGSGIVQKIKANQLKSSNYVPPELLMNQQLAQQQAFSRRAPGAAFAEEQNRRLQSNQIGAAQRMFGGDANKIAAVTAGATQQAQDANSRIAAQGQQFSENAFNRLSNTNSQLAQNSRINQNQYIQTKAALNNAGNTNIYSGISNMGSTLLTSKASKGNVGAQKLLQMQYPTMDNSDPRQYNQNYPSMMNGYGRSGFGFGQRSRGYGNYNPYGY